MKYTELTGGDPCNPADWSTAIVDVSGYASWRPFSSAILPSGRPAISYYDASENDLKYSSRLLGGWHTTTVDSNGNVGIHSSLAILPSGQPAISYYDGSNNHLKYAWQDGSGWRIVTVDRPVFEYLGFEEGVGSRSSLAILASGEPAIAYDEDVFTLMLGGARWTLLKFARLADIVPPPVPITMDYVATARAGWGTDMAINDRARVGDTWRPVDGGSLALAGVEETPLGHTYGAVWLIGEASWWEEDWICVEFDPMTGECMWWDVIRERYPCGDAGGAVEGTVSLGTSESCPAGTPLELRVGVSVKGRGCGPWDYRMRLWRGPILIARVDPNERGDVVVPVVGGEELAFELIASAEDCEHGDEWDLGYGLDFEFQFVVSEVPMLEEKQAVESELVETVVGQECNLVDVVVTGDFNSTLDFSEFEIVTITTGPFAGQGFSTGKCEADLGGILYTGDWKGVVLPDPDERKMHLKGSITGEITATVEGYLTEAVADSNVFDTYEATWKIGRLNDTVTSGIIHLGGDLSCVTASEIPETEVNVVQINMEGTVSGDYDESISMVLTHLRIADEVNPHFGEGFSVISYASNSGAGQGYTYDRLLSPGVVELNGFLGSPLFGSVLGNLLGNRPPRTLLLEAKRVDLGLPPAADLKVTTWGPGSVSPGETVDYVIECRNDGLLNADEVIVFDTVDSQMQYISGTAGHINDDFYDQVCWQLGGLPAQSALRLSMTVGVEWGLASGTRFSNSAYIWERGDWKVKSTAYSTHKSEVGSILYINGINCEKGSPAWLTSQVFTWNMGRALGMDAVWEPIYGLGTGLDWFDVWMAGDNIATENNGLTRPEIVYASYDTVYAYSGGTTTAVTAVWHHNLRCKKLVLMSPNDGGMGTQVFKNTLELMLMRGSVEEIVIYQSESDNIIGGVKIDPDDPWLEGKNVEVRERKQLEHKEWPLYVLSEQLGRLQEQRSSVGASIRRARDPNRKVGTKRRVFAGQRLDYQVEYENEGEGIAFGVYFTDTLDEDLDDSTLEIGAVYDVNTGEKVGEPGIYDPETRTVTWFVGRVDPNQGGIADVNVCVREDAEHGTEIINYATVYFPSVPEETRTNGVVNVVASPCVEALEIGGYEVVGTKRISRTEFEYTMRLRVKNVSIRDVNGATIQLVGVSGNTTILDDSVEFSLIPAGGEALSDDTFAIRTDRSIEGSEDEVVWKIRECEINWGADLDCDWDVDFEDLAVFGESWETGETGLPGDLYPDGKFDFSDVAAFAGEWLIQ